MSEKDSKAASGPGTMKLGVLMLLAGAIGGMASGVSNAYFGGGSQAHAERPADGGPEAGGHGVEPAEAAHGESEATEGHGGTPEQGTPQASPMGVHGAPGVYVPGGDVLSLEPFVVNLADVGEARYLKATIKISFSSPELLPRVKDDPGLLARARDAAIMALSSRTARELVTPEGKEALREQVRRAMETGVGLGPHSVRAVYFTEFVTQ